jgi:hypothetical protein
VSRFRPAASMIRAGLLRRRSTLRAADMPGIGSIPICPNSTSSLKRATQN